MVVLGLDCAAPQLVFDQFKDELEHLPKLMEQSVWGELQSVIPAITVPAWACSMTSRDPGELGIYGFRNRSDYSYDGLRIADATAVKEEAVWDIIGRAGQEVILVAVPPGYPPRRVNGVSVGCFLTPSTKSEYTHPAELRDEIRRVVGNYAVDVENFRSDESARILKEVRAMTERRFSLFRHLLKTRPWQFAMMVEIGVDRMHHGFWRFFDERHHRFEPNNPFRGAMLDYYRLVDQEVGAVLRELDDETAVLVCSDHGAKLMEGGICVNEWLIQEGYLTLKAAPTELAPLKPGDVDWSRTKVWGEGGYYGRIFFNVQGREPEGIVPPDEFAALRDELATKLAAIPDEHGNALNTRVFKPEEIYREQRNVPPDLLTYFDDLRWRSVGSVGSGAIHTHENDTGPDDANHAEEGMFILRAPGLSGDRKLEGARLIDAGPTILDLLGYDIPSAMQGRPIG
ncbi:MAG: alkaline phosphatase family protein [Chloroflexi bacterium]|nr:alkaline phosphatase family protein [Chloroflexota bacterium]